MATIEISSGQETVLTPCFHFRFLWMGDHWKQEIVSVGACEAIPRIWSIERQFSHEAASRPASPAFQFLDIAQERPNIALAHLRGQSGPHHDSATFRFEERPDEVVVDVEMLDSSEETGRPLTATYLIESSTGRLHLDGAATITWTNPDTHLVFEADAPGTIEANEAGMGTIRLRALADPAKEPHLLHYRWRWAIVPGRQLWDREI